MANVRTSGAAEKLRARFSGAVLEPGDAQYEEARRVHNGLIDKRPAVIAQCATSGDVVHAIAMARANGLEIAVRGGGHNVAGRATVEGGLMIDLSRMRSISVDPAAMTATAEGGALWRDLDSATQAHGLATVGGEISTTGIAGLTLGGGVGWLSGKYGLTVDNLLAAEVVAADGAVLRVSEKEHPDLFWALRGGGGNFGVVTSFTYRLHRVGPVVTGGVVAYPLLEAPHVLRFFREIAANADDELRVHAGLLHAPDGSGAKLVALVVGHCGELSAAAQAVRRIKEFGSPILDTVGPMQYCALNSMFDADLPKGALNYWKSSLLQELSDEAIDTLVQSFAVCPAPQSFVMLENFHGAMSRVAPEATAFPHRSEATQLLMLTQWLDPALSDQAISWTRATYEAMRPHLRSARYVNYLDRDDEAGAVAFGANYERLAHIKAKYDPDNVFHQNHNIAPAS